MVYRCTSCGIILALLVSLARLQDIQSDKVPKHESSAEFTSERNVQNFTDDVYGFINDLVQRSTNDNRNRILPTRQIVKNPTVFIQESVTPNFESLSQNRAVEESVANKDEGSSTTIGTLKDKPTDYSASNRAPQGLGAKTNGDVLQLSLIRGARDKDKKSSLVHNTYLELLPRGSSSVFITSVVLPTRTRTTNHGQATAVVPSERTHSDLEKRLVRGSPLPGAIRGISNEYVTRIDERASSYVSTSASTVKYEEQPFAQVSTSSSPSSSLTSSISCISLSSPSPSSLVQTSSSVLPSLLIVDSKELPSSSSSSLSSSSSQAAVPTPLEDVSLSSFPLEPKGLLSSSSSSSLAVAAAKASSHSTSVMLGSSKNGQSQASHQVRTMEVVATPVSTPLLQLSSSVETPSLQTSQLSKKMSSSSSSTTEKEASPFSPSHLNQALLSSSSSSSSSSASSSSETAGTETPLLLSSQLHQGLSSSLASPSLSSSSSSLSPLSSSTTSKTIAMASLLLKPSYLYQGVLPSSALVTASLSMSEEFLSSSSSSGERPDIVTTLQKQDHSSSTLSLETPFLQKNSDLSTLSPKTEIAKSFTGYGTPIFSSQFVTSKSRLPSQQSVYLSSLSKQDAISPGKFTSRDKTDSTLDLFKSTKTLSVSTNSVSLRTNMPAMRLSVSSSTLPVREEKESYVWSPISLPTPSTSVHLAIASLDPSKLPSSSTSSSVKTGESSRPSGSLLPASGTPLKNVGGRIKPTNSISLQHLSTDVVISGSSRYLAMSTLSPSPSSSLSSLTSSSLFTSTSSPIPTLSSLSSSSPSLHAYQSPFRLVATSTLSYRLKSTILSASPTPSLPNAHSPVQSSSSVSPSKHIPDATTSLNTKISGSHEEKNIDNKTVKASRKLQFIVTTVLSGQQTKASMIRETPDLSSSNLSTGFNGMSISHGSAWTPSTNPFSSQTETSTAMSTNAPLDELNQTLSIVSSINGFPHIHHAKRHDVSSISAPTSAPSQLVGLTVDSSGKVNFIKTAETQPTLMKTSPTAASKPKGINAKFIANLSLVVEDSRTSETGTHGLHTKELASSKDAMSMRGSLTTTETGKPMTSRILVSTVSFDIPRPTKTSQTFLRQKTKGAIGSTSPTSTFSTRFVAFPKSSSLNSERHSTLQNVVPVFSAQEKLALTRSSATLKSSTSTSDGFLDVKKSASKETRSEQLGNPQDSMATTDVEKSGSPFTPSMAFHSISPTSTLYTFPSSTSITDGNISIVTTSDGTNTGTKSTDDPNNKILLFIIIAIIPTLLLLILIAIFLFRRVKEREAEPFYKIQVEYTDDNKQRRPRCANSRLDLTIKGMHIDLEFPSPGEKRKSARLSAPPNLSDAQMRELQKLSLECKENLEWINEVLERELDTPVFLGGSSSSENDDSMGASCTNQRYSVYSACSEKEKENYEVSEKIIVRDSPKHTKYNEDETERKSCLQNDADDNNDSETSKDDSDELKIQLDQRTSPKVQSKPQKPEVPPKPKIKLTATDGIGTLANPLTSTIFIECSASEDESRENKFDPSLSKNSTPKERTLLKKPPIPEKKGTLSRKPEKTLRKPELSLTVKNETKKESPCLCNRLSASKPPIPKKPEGLVINRFERKASDGTSGRMTTTLYRSELLGFVPPQRVLGSTGRSEIEEVIRECVDSGLSARSSRLFCEVFLIFALPAFSLVFIP